MIFRPDTEPKENPYVGPRPFRGPDEDGLLYGRDREVREVLSLLRGERILLLHSPSGAGKTSLLQNRVIPTLAKKFGVSGPLRVNAVPPDGVRFRNRYTWSLIVGLTGGDAAGSTEFADMSLDDFLDSDHDPRGGADRRVLVIDQFEEIVTLDPGDREKQAEFFVDLGRALMNENRWLLLSIREDYMGGVEPYAVSIPTHLKTRHRIDFLDLGAALEAIQGPAEAEGVKFHDDAALKIINDLARVKVQLPGHEKAQEVDGPYVEPVQLQVVCTELWRQVSEREDGKLTRIRLKDVERFGKLDAALAGFYGNTVHEVALETDSDERLVRQWFEEQLITEDGFRNQSRRGPNVPDMDKVLQLLEARYVIRSDRRGAAIWYELTHDRLIGPLCRSNETWRYENLDRWENWAEYWARHDKDERYLLGDLRLPDAQRRLTGDTPPSDLLVEYVRKSQADVEQKERQRRRENRLRGMSRLTVAASSLAVVEGIAIALLVALR